MDVTDVNLNNLLFLSLEIQEPDLNLLLLALKMFTFPAAQIPAFKIAKGKIRRSQIPSHLEQLDQLNQFNKRREKGLRQLLGFHEKRA